MAVNSKNDQVALSSIAERNQISPQYLEQVFASLRRAGIVRSVKGSQGGYRLNVPAGQLTVARILEALEGDYRLAGEERPDSSSALGISLSIQKLLINPVNTAMDAVVQNLTLEDLENDYLEYSKYDQDMYYI